METAVSQTIVLDMDLKPITIYDDADNALLSLAKIDAYLQSKEAELNEKLQHIRASFDLETSSQKQMKAMLEMNLETFVMKNKGEFEKSRSREMTHGAIGLRRTPPKIAILNHKYNMKTVLELMRGIKWAKPFVRTKEEPDKEALLAAIAKKEITDAKLASVGLKVDSSENFFYEIKWESIDE
jgi:phage host-nuclease inhibitor protein Gam